MASTYSSNLKIQLMTTGENLSTWGVVTNTNLGTALEEAICGTADITFSSADETLYITNTNATQQARHMRLNLTGVSGGARVLNVPNVEKVYIVNNGLADACTVKVSGQTGVTVPAGKTMLVVNDGTDVLDAITHLSSVTFDSPLPLTSGGTGASSASAARTNLGLAIGSDVQAWNANLDTIAAMAPSLNYFIVGDGSDWTRQTSSNTRTLLGLGSMALQDKTSVSISGGAVGAASVTSMGTNSYGTRTVSTSAPSGGSNNDIWFKY